jgi:hypothetical protein
LAPEHLEEGDRRHLYQGNAGRVQSVVEVPEAGFFLWVFQKRRKSVLQKVDYLNWHMMLLLPCTSSIASPNALSLNCLARRGFGSASSSMAISKSESELKSSSILALISKKKVRKLYVQSWLEDELT